MTEYKFSEKRPHPGQYIEARYPDGEWYRVQYHYEWYGEGILENNDDDICVIDDEGDQMVWRVFEELAEENKTESSVKKLARIIVTNRYCRVIVDSGDWHISKALPESWDVLSYEQQNAWAEGEGKLASSEDFPELGMSYGYGVLQALAHAIGIEVKWA